MKTKRLFSFTCTILALISLRVVFAAFDPHYSHPNTAFSDQFIIATFAAVAAALFSYFAYALVKTPSTPPPPPHE